MAENIGMFKIEGSIDGVTFYNKDGKNLVKKQVRFNKSRYKSSDSYQRVRENSSEFAIAANTGALIRTSMRKFLNGCADKTMRNRMMSKMMELRLLDSENERGLRNAMTVLETEEGKQKLANFDFNSKALLLKTMTSEWELDEVNNALLISNFDVKEELQHPVDATSFELEFAIVQIDFVAGKTKFSCAEKVEGNFAMEKSNLKFKIENLPEIDGCKFFLFKVVFYTNSFGKKYMLKDSSYNSFNILKVG